MAGPPVGRAFAIFRAQGGRRTGGHVMQAILAESRSLELLVKINWDRIFYLGTVVAGLLAGAWVGTIGVQ
jgi:hypothetical protein